MQCYESRDSFYEQFNLSFVVFGEDFKVSGVDIRRCLEETNDLTCLEFITKIKKFAFLSLN